MKRKLSRGVISGPGGSLSSTLRGPGTVQGGSEARGERSYCAPELPYMSVSSLNPRLRRASACAPLFGKRQAGQRAAQLAVLQLDGCLNLAKGQLLRLVEQQQDDGLRRAGGITAAGLLAGGLRLECR